MSKHAGRKAEYPLSATEALNFQSIPAWLREIAYRFTAHQYQIYLVGGAVRDLLWGQVPADWDLTSDALPEQIEALFPNSVPSGKQFGTITVIAGENRAEITTFRSDLGYSDGRRPDAVRFEQSIFPDLARRDFTINAIAYDFTRNLLVDPFGGRRDAYRRILRAVGDPAGRFAEDSLRMFRFFRFLATQDLKPHRPTAMAINSQWAKTLSMERIRDEFAKLLLGRRVRLGLTGLEHSGLMDCFLPELLECRQMDRNYRLYPPLWQHLLVTVETIAPQLHLRLAALLHDIAKPKTRFQNQTGVHFYGHDKQGAEMAQEILGRLRFSGKLIATVANLIRHHMFTLPAEAGDGAVRRFIAKAGADAVPDLLELRRADIVATGRIDSHTYQSWRELRDRINRILLNESGDYQPKLAVNGRDLMACFALPPGPIIGKLLNYLQDLILDDPALNQRELLLMKAQDYLEQNPHSSPPETSA